MSPSPPPSSRRSAAPFSVLLSIAVHGGLAASALGWTAPHEPAARGRDGEWSIELEALPEPAPALDGSRAELANATPRGLPRAPRAAVIRAQRARLASSPPPSSSSSTPVPAAARPPVPPLASESSPGTQLPGPSPGQEATRAESAGSATPAQLPAGPLSLAEVSERPRLLAQPMPRYPPRALRLGIDADVVLSLIVEASGDVGTARVLRAAGHGFDEAALAAARQLRFAPGRVSGVAVAVRVTWTCRFRASG
ncbi:MAG TPA: TonB family protein [Polyangiaceae bacterium]|nr:TonB family protein [Polyangiaceae bacterium]